MQAENCNIFGGLWEFDAQHKVNDTLFTKFSGDSLFILHTHMIKFRKLKVNGQKTVILMLFLVTKMR